MREVYPGLVRRLPFQYYGEVFNPLPVPPESAVLGDLADDLADIFGDIDSGLRWYESGHTAEAVWEWGLHLVHPWGEHATSAIRVLHCWLAAEYPKLLGASDIATAWRANHTWRDDYVFWTARAVSKTGTLEPHDEVLVELGKVLRREEVVWLYCQIRDQSRRCEGEWRAEFLWLFPLIGPSDLPPLPQGEPLDEYPPTPQPDPPGGEALPDIEIPF